MFDSTREPDAVNPHVRFDERDVETERLQQAATAPPRHISTLQTGLTDGMFKVNHTTEVTTAHVFRWRTSILIDRTMNSTQCSIERDDVAGISRVVGCFGLALIATTWRLWLPQSTFPQVSLLPIGAGVPTSIEVITLTLLIAALLTLVVLPHHPSVRRAALLMFVAGALLLVVIDQHRLQPWMYQLGLFAVVLACSDETASLRLLRVIVVSVYLFSAISRLDHSFVHSFGPEFIRALPGIAGFKPNALSPDVLMKMSVALPAGELIAGVLLCLPRFRTSGRVAIVAMHVLLIGVLSPWGLNHQPAVLIWNGFSILIALMLFRDHAVNVSSSLDQCENDDRPRRRRTAVVRHTGNGMAVAVVGMSCLAAASNWLGVGDNWIGWGLYATRSEQVRVYVHATAIETLPPTLKPHVSGPELPGEWHRVRIDRWSLEQLQAPVYPEDRFLLGVTHAAFRDVTQPESLLILFESVASRRDGQRTETVIRSLPELRERLDTFYLNAVSRDALTAAK